MEVRTAVVVGVALLLGASFPAARGAPAPCLSLSACVLACSRGPTYVLRTCLESCMQRCPNTAGPCAAHPNAAGHVDIPGNKTHVSFSDFAACGPNLTLTTTSMSIPGTVKYVDGVGLLPRLQSVDLAEGVLFLDHDAFDGTNLSGLVVPRSVNYTQYDAFEALHNLRSVTIPIASNGAPRRHWVWDSDQGIWFARCYGVDQWAAHHYNDPSIWSDAKWGLKVNTPVFNATADWAQFWCLPCAGVANLTVPSNVTAIGNFSFTGCKDVVSVRILGNVTHLGSSGFANMASLASVDIPDTVKSMGSSVFAGCTSLTHVTIGDGLTSVGPSAFAGCSSLTTLTFRPNTMVASIGAGAFAGCGSLTWMAVPNTVTAVGSGAFVGCIALTWLDIPSKTTMLGVDFPACYGLGLLTDAQPGPSARGNLSCLPCAGVANLSVPAGVTAISNNSFYGCAQVSSVTIAASVQSIGSNAFAYSASLTSVKFVGNHVTHIGSFAFQSTGLTSVEIPDSVTELGARAFFNCYLMATVIIGAGVTRIEESTFRGCGSLTTLTIGAKVTSIEAGAFSGCYSLASVAIPRSVNRIAGAVSKEDPTMMYTGGAFSFCLSLGSVRIPSTTTSIGAGAFAVCPSLRSVLFERSDHTTRCVDTTAFDNSGCTFAAVEGSGWPSNTTNNASCPGRLGGLTTQWHLPGPTTIVNCTGATNGRVGTWYPSVSPSPRTSTPPAPAPSATPWGTYLGSTAGGVAAAALVAIVAIWARRTASSAGKDTEGVQITAAMLAATDSRWLHGVSLHHMVAVMLVECPAAIESKIVESQRTGVDFDGEAAATWRRPLSAASTATMWHMVWAYVRPRTAAARCSYLELLHERSFADPAIRDNHCGPASAMISCECPREPEPPPPTASRYATPSYRAAPHLADVDPPTLNPSGPLLDPPCTLWPGTRRHLGRPVHRGDPGAAVLGDRPQHERDSDPHMDLQSLREPACHAPGPGCNIQGGATREWRRLQGLAQHCVLAMLRMPQRVPPPVGDSHRGHCRHPDALTPDPPSIAAAPALSLSASCRGDWTITTAADAVGTADIHYPTLVVRKGGRG